MYISLIPSARHRAQARVHRVATRSKNSLVRGIDRVNAEIVRSLRHSQREESLTAIYPEPLPPGSIRLLTVLYDKTEDDGTLHCRLETYPLTVAPRYDAVSYCWGTDPHTTRILCNGFDLQVRNGLVAFLKASKDRDSSSRPLWIDAICLNQQNQNEKNAHVPLMHQVYKRASRTFIWLGEPDENTDDGLDWLTKTMPDWMRSGKGKVDDPVEVMNSDLMRLKRCAATYPVQWKAASDYLSRPWFNRLWCLQEVILSRKLYFLCHTEQYPSISWTDLNDHLSVVPMGSTIHTLYGTIVSRESMFTASEKYKAGNIQLIDFTRQWSLNHNTQLDLSSVRRHMKGRECCEPVDRLWALLGIVSSELAAVVKEANIIDYSEAGRRKYWESYLNFMKVLYRYKAEEFFEVVLEELVREKHPLLPSWCPDFTRAVVRISLTMHRDLRAGFRNNQDKFAIDSSLSDTGPLSMLGFQIDTVSRTTSVWITPRAMVEHNYSELPAACGELHAWLTQCRQFWGEEEEHEEGVKPLCCTLAAADQGRINQKSFSGKWLESLDGWLNSIAAMSRGDAATAREVVQFARDWGTEMLLTIEGRRIFTTESGRLGLGPAELQEGDLICVLRGAGAVFALRPVDVDEHLLDDRDLGENDTDVSESDKVEVEENHEDVDEEEDDADETKQALDVAAEHADENEKDTDNTNETERNKYEGLIDQNGATYSNIKEADMGSIDEDGEEDESTVASPTGLLSRCSGYKLLGDAYVYGMMSGEAFTASGRGPEQYFALV